MISAGQKNGDESRRGAPFLVGGSNRNRGHGGISPHHLFFWKFRFSWDILTPIWIRSRWSHGRPGFHRPSPLLNRPLKDTRKWTI